MTSLWPSSGLLSIAHNVPLVGPRSAYLDYRCLSIDR